MSDKRYRYTGKERDEETGLYYHGARYYAPWLGRWTAADPAGMVDGANLYSYACGNPVRWSDPGGQQTQTDDVPPIPAECLGGGEASWRSSCLASVNEPRSVGGFEWVPDSYKGLLKSNQRRGDPYQRLAIDDPLGGAPLIGIENWRYEQLAETARARRFLQTLDNATSGGIPGAVGANISDEASDFGAWAMQTAASGHTKQNSAGEGALGHLSNRYGKNAPFRTSIRPNSEAHRAESRSKALIVRPTEIRFPARGLSPQEQLDFSAHLLEQQVTLNRLSLESPEVLRSNLLNYQNIKSELEVSRRLARSYLPGDGRGLDAAHALDAVGGGHLNEFVGFRPRIQERIGALWRTRAKQIQPGREHRLVPEFLKK